MESREGNLPTVHLRSCLSHGLQPGSGSYQLPQEQYWGTYTNVYPSFYWGLQSSAPGKLWMSECFKWVKLHESIHLEFWHLLWSDWSGWAVLHYCNHGSGAQLVRKRLSLGLCSVWI